MQESEFQKDEICKTGIEELDVMLGGLRTWKVSSFMIKSL